MNKVKVCAGEGGLRSWEWCGGGGVEGSGGVAVGGKIGELVCCGVKWRRTWGVVWEWWSEVECGEIVGKVLAGKPGSGEQ
nr:hypothetical protein [Tanacetum cinerariifolium]